MKPFLSTIIVVLSLLLASSFSAVLVSSLHIGAFCLPFYGHFLPVKAIAEQLVLRDHKVTFFVENLDWCRSVARRPSAAAARTKNNNNNSTEEESNIKKEEEKHDDDYQSFDGLRCIKVPDSGTFGTTVFETLSRSTDNLESWTVLLEQLNLHQELQLEKIYKIAKQEHEKTPFDAVLYDMSTFIGADIAAALAVPRIAVFPLVLTLATSGVLPSVPMHGSGFPRDMTIPQRLFTSTIGWITPLTARNMIEKIHIVRRKAGIVNAVYHDHNDIAVMYDHVIAPTIWGHDVAMPLCPHVKPVGIIESLPAPDSKLEPELRSFFDDVCGGDGDEKKQRVYINFGTLSTMSPDMFEKMIEAVRILMRDDENCVIWKLRSDLELQKAESALENEHNKHLLFLRKRFNDPQKILPEVHVFVSHCGDTSVGEALNHLTPVAGLPFFADQVDVCARMEERGFGVMIGLKNKFTTQDVVDKVREIGIAKNNKVRRSQVEKALREARDVARWLGGSPEAARWIEVIVENNITRAFHCRHLNPDAIHHDMDGTWASHFQQRGLSSSTSSSSGENEKESSSTSSLLFEHLHPWTFTIKVFKDLEFDLFAIYGVFFLFGLRMIISQIIRFFK